MWIFGTLGSFLVNLDRVVASGGLGRVVGFAFFLFVVFFKREGVLVAPAPVILELAVAPLLLEGCLTGIFGGSVVEVPRVVAVDVIASWLLGVVLQSGARCTLLGHIGLAIGGFFLLFLFLLQLFDDFSNHLFLFLERHLR